MSNINWSFADNLQIPAGKYLKWLDPTGVTRNNILGLNTSSNVYLNSGQGDIYFNSNNNGSNTFFNVMNTGNSLFNTKVGISINNTSNMISNLVLPNFGWIGLNSTQGNHSGYIGLAASSSLLNTTGSKILLYGNDATGGNSGSVNIYTGNTTTGNIQLFTGNNNKIVQVLNNGTTNFSPDGSDITISITSTGNTVTTPIIITNTTQSNNSSSGALIVSGGVGIIGDTYITGKLSIDSILGNLNFNNTNISTSYSNGTFFISGGLGIECSYSASSITSGGAISIAGGLALGKNAFIGGDINIMSTSISISAVSGSGIFYGGIGINGQTNIRSDQNSQIRITPVTNGMETSILFGNQNNYTTSGSWSIGQNINSIGSGNFGISSKDNGSFMTLNNNSQVITLNKFVSLVNNLNFNNNSSNNLITLNDTQGNISWSIGRITTNTTGNFQISRFSQGNFINYVLNSDIQTGNVSIFGTENSINNNSGGALTILGGASIAKDVYIGGNVYGGNINFSGSLISQSTSDTNIFSYVTITASDQSINSSSGCLVTFGGVTIQSTVDTVSSTNGGSFLVLGGASIKRSLIVGNTITSSVISTINGSIINSTISNINSTNGTITNVTNVNLLNTNSTILNLQNTNSTVINIFVSNSSFGNVYSNIGNILQLNTVNITSNSGYITNITSTNTLLTNISSSNASITNLVNTNSTLTNLIVSKSILNNVTIGTILLTSTANLSYNSNTIGNLFTTGGNIGINITSPNSNLSIYNTTNQLDVQATTGSILSLVTNTGTSGSYMNMDFSTYLNGSNRIDQPLPGMRISLQDDNTSSNHINILSKITGSGSNLLASRVYIQSNGLIGINTTMPNYTLDINGNFRTQNTNCVNNTVNNISNTTGSNNFSSDIVLSNQTRNSLLFNQVGISPPTFNTRSLGSKIVFYPNISSNTLDYSIGVESQALWFSNSGTNGFKWYNNSTSSNMILNNTGLAINTFNVNPIYTLDINGTGRFVNSIIGQFNSNTLGNIYTTGGNVGINQVNPQFTLDITGSSRITNKLSAIYNTNTLGNLYTTGGNIGINNSSPNQLVEMSPITYNSNLSGGIRIGTSNYVNNNDSSYRYIDLRLISDSMTNFRGSILGTLNGGISSEYEYISFNQSGTISIYPSTTFYDSTVSTNSNTGAIIVKGGIGINNGSNATGTANGGSLTVNGGGAFSQDLYIGGNLTVTGSILYADAGTASSTFAYLTLTASDNSVNLSTGSLVTIGGISIQANGNATSSTSGGGLTVAGGIGCKQDIYIGGTSYIKNIQNTNSNSLISTISNLLVTNGFKSIFNSNTLGNIYTTGGNTGIGCVQPVFPLTIGNSNGNNGTVFLQAANNPSIGFGAGSNNYMWISAPLQSTGGLLSLGGNGTIAPTSGGVLNINNSGLIGINNTNPTFALDITGILNLRTSSDSINSSVGTLVSSGGISISKTTNSTSTTSGGALTIAGGMSVFRDIFVGGTITSSSDKFLKKNIKHLPSILDKISNINPIIYNNINELDTKDYIGFIAQDFKEHFPELLRRENENAYYSLAYDRITALNFKCIKELLNEINKLKNIIKSLQN